MVLNKQTSTRWQCFCLHQEMPKDISVIGYIEDEVLFSFLVKTKIEHFPSLSIFSFVYVVQTLAYKTFCKSCGTSSCAVPYSCRDMDSLPAQQSSSSPCTLFLFLLSTVRPKHTLVPWDWWVPMAAPSSGKHFLKWRLVVKCLQCGNY